MTTERETSAPEFLTVRELAELLRIKERKVYDLAASGEVPCTRVTGKLLFPETAVRAWIAEASSGGDPLETALPNVFVGSHDPLLEWALRQSLCGLATYFDGSLDGLRRFVAREGVAAALHVTDTGGGWNISAVEQRRVQGAVLVAWAVRSRGLVLREADASAIHEPQDLRGRRVVPRQAESGTHLLFERLLRDAGLSTDDIDLTAAARSEADAVSAVAQGTADVAFGLESLASLHRLRFVPLVEERFDILVDRAAWFEPPMQRFVAFCQRPEFREHAKSTPGYDVNEMFAVRWNA